MTLMDGEDPQLVDLTIVGLIKANGHRYLFAYDDQSQDLIHPALLRMVLDTELDFDPSDVVTVLDTIQRLGEEELDESH